MKPFKLTVMMYHYVRDPGDRAEAGSGIPGLSVDHFTAQLDQLRRQHSMISWPDLRDYFVSDKELPPDPCLLTFDDGVCDHHLNVFPALRARGLSGLFFGIARPANGGLVLAHIIHFLLARLGLEGLRDAILKRLTDSQLQTYLQAEAKYQTRYGSVDTLKAILQRDLSAEVDGVLSELFAEHVGGELSITNDYYLTDAQIKEMAAGGMHFGGHSRNHPWFDWIDAEQQTAEIKASAAWLENIEPGPWAFAYPYGGLSQSAPALLRAHGFIAAFTTKSHLEHTDPYHLGRLDGEEYSIEMTALTQVAGN